MNLSQWIDQIGDHNPQLFRELKGRFTPRYLTIATVISLMGQSLIFLIIKTSLPPDDIYQGFRNRYCLGSLPNESSDNVCLPQLGHLMINWQLWWLDIFITLSIIGLICLLTVGVYLLIADLAQEESRGTLNFIRLSPQSARGIFIGKLLGVPSLIYWGALLGIPFHLLAGFNAHIPFSLIMGFYGVVIASCIFFFNGALLWGLISPKLGTLQAFIISGVCLLFLSVMTGITLHAHYNEGTPFDWFTLFYPGIVLPYLVQGTFMSPQTVNYLPVKNLHDLQWYGLGIWQNTAFGIAFVIANFALWSYSLTQGMKRRFRNPSGTLLSKKQSYLLSACFIVLSLGFVLQTTDNHRLYENMQMLQAQMAVFMVILIAALSPHRHTLQDWTRYRHQNSKTQESLLKDLLLAEKSPSLLAIVVNFGMMLVYLLPAIFRFPLAPYREATIGGFILGGSVLLIYALVSQWVLLQKTSKRAIWATASVASLMIFPLIAFSFFSFTPHRMPQVWLLTFLPMVAVEKVGSLSLFLSLFGQWTIIVLGGILMRQQLKKMGQSESQGLLKKG